MHKNDEKLTDFYVEMPILIALRDFNRKGHMLRVNVNRTNNFNADYQSDTNLLNFNF